MIARAGPTAGVVVTQTGGYCRREYLQRQKGGKEKKKEKRREQRTGRDRDYTRCATERQQTAMLLHGRLGTLTSSKQHADAAVPAYLKGVTACSGSASLMDFTWRRRPWFRRSDPAMLICLPSFYCFSFCLLCFSFSFLRIKKDESGVDKLLHLIKTDSCPPHPKLHHLSWLHATWRNKTSGLKLLSLGRGAAVICKYVHTYICIYYFCTRRHV